MSPNTILGFSVSSIMIWIFSSFVTAIFIDCYREHTRCTKEKARRKLIIVFAPWYLLAAAPIGVFYLVPRWMGRTFREAFAREEKTNPPRDIFLEAAEREVETLLVEAKQSKRYFLFDKTSPGGKRE